MSAITYTVHWERLSEPDGKLSCSGLTPRQFLARVIGAIKTSGPIAILGVKKDVTK